MRAKKMEACELADDGDDLEFPSGDGITMECTCPKCGARHRLKLLWAGRGKPKKFCQACKMYIATLETVDLPCIPASIGRIMG